MESEYATIDIFAFYISCSTFTDYLVRAYTVSILFFKMCACVYRNTIVLCC